MATYKYLYWRPDSEESENLLPKKDGKTRTKDGLMFCNVHVLVGYNQASLVDFRNMGAIIKKTFPAATDSQILGGKVFKSSYVNGFTIVTWSGRIKKRAYRGWYAHEHGRMEYYW